MEGRPLDETALVRQAKAGDVDAFGELVQRHSDLAFRTAVLVTGSAADAEDATQEAFLAAWHALRHFRENEPLRPWLLRIVANQARNRRRAERRRQTQALTMADRLVVGDAAPSPEDEAEAAEERAALLRALATLDDAHRAVIGCRHLLELSVAETASVLDCREGTVKSRLARALSRLRAALGERP